MKFKYTRERMDSWNKIGIEIPIEYLHLIIMVEKQYQQKIMKWGSGTTINDIINVKSKIEMTRIGAENPVVDRITGLGIYTLLEQYLHDEIPKMIEDITPQRKLSILIRLQLNFKAVRSMERAYIFY